VIASFAMRLLGRITRLPSFVRIFVARQVTAVTIPRGCPQRSTARHENGRSNLNADPGEQVGQRVLERETHGRGRDCGAGQRLRVASEYVQGDRSEQGDDDRVLHDGRGAVRRAIPEPRVEYQSHEEVDERERMRAVSSRVRPKDSRDSRSAKPASPGASPRPTRSRLHDEVRDRQDQREEQAPAHEAVADNRHRGDGHASDRQSRDQMPQGIRVQVKH